MGTNIGILNSPQRNAYRKEFNKRKPIILGETYHDPINEELVKKDFFAKDVDEFKVVANYMHFNLYRLDDGLNSVRDERIKEEGQSLIDNRNEGVLLITKKAQKGDELYDKKMIFTQDVDKQHDDLIAQGDDPHAPIGGRKYRKMKSRRRKSNKRRKTKRRKSNKRRKTNRRN